MQIKIKKYFLRSTLATGRTRQPKKSLFQKGNEILRIMEDKQKLELYLCIVKN